MAEYSVSDLKTLAASGDVERLADAYTSAKDANAKMTAEIELVKGIEYCINHNEPGKLAVLLRRYNKLPASARGMAFEGAS